MWAKVAQRPLFNLGFRIFFLSSAASAVLFMVWWLLAYSFHWALPVGALQLPQYWHGHEMLFGFAVAVVAGFLLTAVQNWTAVPMPAGGRLLALWLPWLGARFVFFFAPGQAVLGGLLDFCFTTALNLAVINACRQKEGQLKRQAGIIAKLSLLMGANLLFLWGLTRASVLATSLYFGVFVIIGLVITIGRRVLPFFTRNGLMPQQVQFEPRNSENLDKWCLRAFLVFFTLELLRPHWKVPGLDVAIALFALATGLLNLYRLAGWWHWKVLKVPLLWSMFFSFAAMIFGFLLYGLRPWLSGIAPSLAMHSFAVGGLALMALSMMGRVSLGHTGRNIMAPPRVLVIALFLMVASYLLRVPALLLWPKFSPPLIMLAQLAWLGAFGLLCYGYWAIWCSPRVDGKPG